MHFFEIGLHFRKRGSFFNLTDSSKIKIKYNIYIEILFYLNLFLKTYGLQIERLVLSQCNDAVKVDYDENDLSIEVKKESYNIFKKKFTILNNAQINDRISVKKETELQKLQRTFKHQKAKEIANLSNKSYRLFRKQVYDKANCKLISLDKLNIFKKRFLNAFFKTDKNKSGFYVYCIQKIEFVLKKIIEYQRVNLQAIENNTFNLHLSGDGCSISKTKINLVNFCFKILNKSEEKDNTSRLYTLGLFIF